jgi:hypothetical protein
VAQSSLRTLRRDLFLASWTFATTTAIPPTGPVAVALDATAIAITTFTQAAEEVHCEVETRVEYVTREVWGWISHLLVSAADQALKCADDCLRRPALQIPGCLWDCAHHVFVDLFESTYELIETITEELVTTKTHCDPVESPPSVVTVPEGVFEYESAGVVPGGGGAPPQAAPNVDKVLELIGGPAFTVISCLVKGEWNWWRVGGEVPGEEWFPIGVQVCMTDPKCIEALKSLVGFKVLFDFGATIHGLLSGATTMEAVLAASPSFGGAANALAPVLGLSAARAGWVILALLGLILYHEVAILGQIWAQELEGKLKDGICLHHPSLLVAAAPLLFMPLLNASLLTPVLVRGK